MVYRGAGFWLRDEGDGLTSVGALITEPRDAEASGVGVAVNQVGGRRPAGFRIEQRIFRFGFRALHEHLQGKERTKG